MEQLQLILISLMPALGTLLAILLVAWKIVSQFKGLRAEVKDEGTIKEIQADNKRLNAMYRETLEEVRDLKEEIRTLSQINQNLISTINAQNRGV